MITTQQMIQAQANAVKGGSNAIQIAVHLEKAAKLLRAEATKPVKLDFSLAVKEKASRLAKFGAAIMKGRQESTHQTLTTAGFSRGMFNATEDTAQYGTKIKPGYLIKIKGDRFTVSYHDEIKVDRQPLSNLAHFLTENK